MGSETEGKQKSGKKEQGLNKIVLALIAVGTLLFIIGNSYEPEIEESLDFYEASVTAGFGVAAIFGFRIAKKYWGSEVFGRAYLSLSIGYACYFIGWALWFTFEIVFQVENPYPYYPDIFYFAFYPFAIYHLRANINYFSRNNLRKSQKVIIPLIPFCTTLFYAIFGFVPMDASETGLGFSIPAISDYDQTFYIEYFTGLSFVAATSFTFSSAIVGFYVFRSSILGPAWGLLLVGIALNTMADIYYYINELFGGYVRADPVTGIWTASTIVVCYALYKHRKII